MKLTDFLQDVGRPVAYYPRLRKITGSTNATILLCQLIYWRGKESSQDGWLYKESDEIEEETGLSYEEQKTARRRLIDAGLIEEHYARLDHQMKFLVLLDSIDEKWGNHIPPVPEQGIATMGNDGKPLSLDESEITAETTTIGVDTPTENLPLDWKIANDLKITEADLRAETDRKMVDAANLIATGFGINAKAAYNIAYAFQVARWIVIPTDKVKGQRKAVKEMLDAKPNAVFPAHVVQAVKKLTTDNMTIKDLFSVVNTAITLANPAPNQPQSFTEHNPLGI